MRLSTKKNKQDNINKCDLLKFVSNCFPDYQFPPKSKRPAQLIFKNTSNIYSNNSNYFSPLKRNPKNRILATKETEKDIKTTKPITKPMSF